MHSVAPTQGMSAVYLSVRCLRSLPLRPAVRLIFLLSRYPLISRDCGVSDPRRSSQESELVLEEISCEKGTGVVCLENWFQLQEFVVTVVRLTMALGCRHG